jgi:hypothetical protein
VSSSGGSRTKRSSSSLREYLFARQFRALRQELMPYAEAQGVFTDEDVFRELS